MQRATRVDAPSSVEVRGATRRRCPRCSAPPSATASTSPTSPSPSPRSRPSSSTSPGRTSANELPITVDTAPPSRSAPRRKPGRRDARRVPRAAAARPRRAAQDAQGVHPAHAPPAVPAGLRVHLRVPEDRPGRRRHRRGESSSPRCSSPAWSALAIMFQGIQSVALPMVQEFGYTREIEDRVLAPMPVSLVAIQKAVWGALSGLFSALLVFPIAAIVPATPVHLDINWPVLLTLDAARLLHVRRARAHVRHPLRPAHGAAAVRHHRDPAHVPRLRSTTRGRRSSRSAGCRSSCSSTRSCTCARDSAPRSRQSRT